MKRTMGGLLLLGFLAHLLTGCGAVKIREGIAHDDLILAGTAANDVQATGFEEIARSAALTLLINPDTAEILLRDRRGAVDWRSNPADRSQTAVGAESLSYTASQLTLTYSAADGTQTTLHSYKDSVEKGQYQIERTKNGAKVQYTLGTAEEIKRVPAVITAARFQEKFLDKLGEEDRKTLLRRYAYLDLSSIDDEQYRREMEARFPLSKQEPLYYLRSIPAPPNIEREVDALAEKAGYTLEDLEADNRANGIEAARQEPAFNISVYYALEDERLVVRIPASEIQMPEDALIESISLLDCFGAGGTHDSGYMLVPDGSGALVYFNNGKTSRSEYAVPVYGKDQALSQDEQVLSQTPAVLPVFGIKNGEAALFCVIENGEALASVCCQTAKAEQAYNLAYPSFSLRQKENIDLGSGKSKVYVFQTERYQGDLAVSYYPLSGQQADYSGMAAVYRGLLFGDGPAALPDIPPLYLEFLGSVEKAENLLGFPYQKKAALTTFREIEEQVNALGSLRENLQVRLSGWCNGGLNHTVFDEIRVQKELGGEKGLTALAAALRAQGVGLYPDADWQYTRRTGRGYSTSEDTARLLNHTVAQIYPYNPATYLADRKAGRSSYLNAPHVVERTAAAFLEAYAPLGIDGLSLGSLARDVNADYNEHRMVERQTAAEMQEAQVAKAAAAGYSLLVRSGNAYALPYVSHVLEVPMESNGFDLADESVPFVPMVLSGQVQYAGPPRNLDGGGRTAWLRCLETGAGLYYVLAGVGSDFMKDTAYPEYYAVGAEEWLPTLTGEYGLLAETMRGIYGKPILRHEKLADGVYRTTYQGGAEVTVNYGNSSYTDENGTVEAESYAVRT